MASLDQLAARSTRGYPAATDDQRRRHQLARTGQVKRPTVSWVATCGSQSLGQAQQSEQGRIGLSASKYTSASAVWYQRANHRTGASRNGRLCRLAQLATPPLSYTVHQLT